MRGVSETLCSTLEKEDFGVQPSLCASPPKWHLAHTSWFFETFLLKPYVSNYQIFHPQFEYLFNSYYNGVGNPYPRADRGLLSRPTVDEVFTYRRHVDEALLNLLAAEDHQQPDAIAERVLLGLHHEQQHQELIVTDLKYNFGFNPLSPSYANPLPVDTETVALKFCSFEGGLIETGASTESDRFVFDNETPIHSVYLHPFRLSNRLTTNEDYLEFVEDGGYADSRLWLSDGWSALCSGQLSPAPLYWQQQDGDWFEYTLSGLEPLRKHTPVTHVSFFEADAFARWAGRRLPSEAEWEHVAKLHEVDGNLAESGWFHPRSAQPEPVDLASAAQSREMLQMFGDVWEWTQSSYQPYPGFRALEGTLGEYNGKFMSSQMVLRGGSCVTPSDHIRASYRNFFYPSDCWQFSGIRLASDI